MAESQREYLAVLHSAVCWAKISVCTGVWSVLSRVHDNTERQLERGAYLDEGSMDEKVCGTI